MAIDETLLSKFAEMVKRVEDLVEMLLGNIYEEYPDTLRGFFLKNGVAQEELDKMSAQEMALKASEIWQTKATRTETLMAALDLLFQARYGWEEGRAGRMTPNQAFLALEHAMEHDHPGKPSIWDVTK
jgi:hypothetical protein